MEGPVKTIVTFAAGAVLASGIAYFSINRQPAPPPQQTAQVQQEQQVPEPAAMPPATEVKPEAAAPEPVTPKPEAKVGWKPAAASKATKKPSAMNGKSASDKSSSGASSSAPQQTAQNHTPAQQPAPIPNPTGGPMLPVDSNERPLPPPPPKREPKTITIPAGTLLAVRVDQGLDTKKNHTGDSFPATLDQPLVIDNMVIAEKGSRVEGRVVEADEGGRVKGLAQLQLELVGLNTSDGQRVKLQTESFTKQAQAEKGKDAAKIGAAAGIGAAIGAIAGGGKGAGLGAIIGGAAGTGGVMATRGAAAQVPAETRLSFRLRNAITITERLD